MGFYTDFPKYWLKLDAERVENIQNEAGTILGSSRGGFDADKMVEALVKKGINQLYCIGGDGTLRGVSVLTEALRKKNC